MKFSIKIQIFLTTLSLLIAIVKCQWVRDQTVTSRAKPLSVGGTSVTRGDAKWLCPVFLEINQGEKNYICGSSLITNNFVLTGEFFNSKIISKKYNEFQIIQQKNPQLPAAHCLQPKGSSLPHFVLDIIVQCGTFDLSNLKERNQQPSVAKNLFINPAWDYTTKRYDGDIALIELKVPMKVSKFVQKIALPPFESSPFDETTGFVIGYGRSEGEGLHETKPRKIEIPIVSNDDCVESQQTISVIKSRDAFCAGKKNVVPCKLRILIYLKKLG